MKFYLVPQDRHLFYSILKSRYFDYSSILYSICEVIEDQGINEIISDLESNGFDDEIIADCICLAAKNGPWRGRSSFAVNPIISKHFKSRDWPIKAARDFLNIAFSSQNYRTRWDAILNQEYLFLYFESSDLWRTIRSQSVKEASNSDLITSLIKQLIKNNNLKKNMQNNDILALICKVILIGSIQKQVKLGSSELVLITDFMSDILYFIEMNYYEKMDLWMPLFNLLIHFNDTETFPADGKFVMELLSIIEPVCTPAIILNVIVLFYEQLEADFNSFENVTSAFFQSPFTLPTVQETCALVRLARSPQIIEAIIKVKLASHPNLLQHLYLECPESIPHQVIRMNFPFQLRLQTELRKHRKIVNEENSVRIELPSQMRAPQNRIDSLAKQLEILHEREIVGFKAYNFPVILRQNIYFETKKSFVVAIDYFFDAFFKCETFYYVLDEDGSIVPNLINLNPKILETFGYLMAASIILQHPLQFKLNLDYFYLIRSDFKPQFHRFLFEIYPQSDLMLVSWLKLAEHLQEGVVKFYSGFSKAFEVEHFSLYELYILL